MSGAGNAQPGPLTAASLAEKLGVIPLHQENPVVKEALQTLVKSPALKDGRFPPLRIVNMRQRTNYFCRHCHQVKKNHVCTATPQQKEANLMLPQPEKEGSQKETDRANKRPRKRRKKSFKPLQVILLDNQNETIQSTFQHIHHVVGEANVSMTLTITPSHDGSGDYAVAAFASFGVQRGLFLGSLSPMYKPYAKAAIEDSTMSKIELAPLEEFVNDHGKKAWLSQLILYRTKSWDAKPLVEIDYLNAVSSEMEMNEPQIPSPGGYPTSPVPTEPPPPILVNPAATLPLPLPATPQEQELLRQQAIFLKELVSDYGEKRSEEQSQLMQMMTRPPM